MRLFVRQPTDKALIEGILHGGNRRRFCEDRLYQKYAYLIRDGIRKHQISEDESASAYADAVLTLIEKRCGGGFSGQSELKTELYAIFTEKCAALARQKTNSPERISPSDLQADAFKLQLSRMSDKCRDMLLAWGEGMSDDAIAQQLNYPTGTAVNVNRLRCLGRFGGGDKTEPPNELKTVDAYFTENLPTAEQTSLENRLQTDPFLAEIAAFYVHVREIARNEARSHRLAEMDELRPRSRKRQLPVWIYASTAACLLLLAGLGYWLSLRASYADAFANHYIEQHFGQLSNSIDIQSDSVRAGIQYFNQGQFTEAQRLFNARLQQTPNDNALLKLSGLVSLRLGHYDQAIDCFSRLGQHPDSFAHPGVFYEAIACLKQGQPNDKHTAKELLRRVVQEDLEGRDEAERLLKGL